MNRSSAVSFVLQANVFDEYQMEGVAPDDNEICLEVTPENLSRALKTVQNAKAVKVKLTKKHCPCLTIAAELVRIGSEEPGAASVLVPFQTLGGRFYICAKLLVKPEHLVEVCRNQTVNLRSKNPYPASSALQPTLSSASRVVTHDVPVDVIPRRLWHEFKEPSMPDFDVSEAVGSEDLGAPPPLTVSAPQVSIYLPPLKTMKNVVDRMKNLSNFLVNELASFG